MDYKSWEQSVPAAISDDPLWKMRVYRLALFAATAGEQLARAALRLECEA